MSSSNKVCLLQKVVFHWRSSSTKDYLPPKVVFHQRLSSTYHNTFVHLIFVRTVNIPNLNFFWLTRGGSYMNGKWFLYEHKATHWCLFAAQKGGDRGEKEGGGEWGKTEKGKVGSLRTWPWKCQGWQFESKKKSVVQTAKVGSSISTFSNFQIWQVYPSVIADNNNFQLGKTLDFKIRFGYLLPQR